MKRLILLPFLFLIVLFCKGQNSNVKIDSEYFLFGTLDDYMGRETYKHIANRVDAYYKNNTSLVIYLCSILKDRYPELTYKTNSYNADRLDLLSESLAKKMNAFYNFKASGGGVYIGKEDFRTIRVDTIINNKRAFNTYFDSTFIGTVKKDIFKNNLQRLSFIAGAFQRFGEKKDSTYSITMYNSTSKAQAIYEQLKELKCTAENKVNNTFSIPNPHRVIFTPTAELKAYLEYFSQKIQ